MVGRLAAAVRVTGESGAPVVLAAGEELPGWAADQVTNPAAFVEDESEGDEPSDSPDEPVEDESTTDAEPGPEEAGGQPEDTETATGSDYEAMTVTDLRSEIRSRNEDGRDDDAKMPTDGVKADLIAALEADDQAGTA